MGWLGRLESAPGIEDAMEHALCVIVMETRLCGGKVNLFLHTASVQTIEHLRSQHTLTNHPFSGVLSGSLGVSDESTPR